MAGKIHLYLFLSVTLWIGLCYADKPTVLPPATDCKGASDCLLQNNVPPEQPLYWPNPRQACVNVKNVSECIEALDCDEDDKSDLLTRVAVHDYVCENINDTMSYKDCVTEALSKKVPTPNPNVPTTPGNPDSNSTRCSLPADHTCEDYDEYLSCKSKKVTEDCPEGAQDWYYKYLRSLGKPMLESLGCSGASIPAIPVVMGALLLLGQLFI